MTGASRLLPKNLLAVCRVPGADLFMLGTFDRGVTVLSQQVRALNLAWAMVEDDIVPEEGIGGPKRIAIVGGGFAGLSIAAGLLSKKVNAEITILEQRDTLLPLQQGSDTRWLHPRIYDWPAEGSEAGSAMLPVLNWTAARASDVVVQILRDWDRIIDAKPTSQKLRLYCNTRHLQVHEVGPARNRLMIEWVGEERAPESGTSSEDSKAVGRSEEFDVVVLAVGFGLEKDKAFSYWRNEILAQPSLEKKSLTYVVSGQGDGAMIDLLRLRISQFRQDRILAELFDGRRDLLDRLREIHSSMSARNGTPDLFETLEGLDDQTGRELSKVVENLSVRLRRDTNVILHLQVRKFSQLFDDANTRISFQNKLLVYLLYKCGGFFPSSLKLEDLLAAQGIDERLVVRRHGTERDALLKELLSDHLYSSIENQRKGNPKAFLQSDEIQWSGGYFGFPGKSKNAKGLADSLKGQWRKEYLPGPTALLALSFCSGLTGFLKTLHPKSGRLRVTVHRAIAFGGEQLLQQLCEYQGIGIDPNGPLSAGRTFPAGNATIGVAFKSRKIVRSTRAVEPLKLNKAMEKLELNEASRGMSKDVCYVLAIPLLSEVDVQQGKSTEVVGVIYADSTSRDFELEDRDLTTMVAMAQCLVNALSCLKNDGLDRVRSVPLATKSATDGITMHANNVPDGLELVQTVSPPKVVEPIYLNYDHSDFVPVRRQ